MIGEGGGLLPEVFGLGRPGGGPKKEAMPGARAQQAEESSSTLWASCLLKLLLTAFNSTPRRTGYYMKGNVVGFKNTPPLMLA